MKLFKKLCSVGMILMLFTFSLCACSSDEAQVYNSLIKAFNINSMEAKSDVTVHFSVEGLSESAMASVASTKQMLNNLKVSIDSKLNSSQDKKVVKAQYEGEVEIGGMAVKFGAWLDSNTNGDKQIYKIPAILTTTFPQKFAGNEHIIMDLAKIANASNQNIGDINKMNELKISMNQFMYTEFVNFLKEYGKQFDSKLNLVKKLENNKYQVKFDDASFKAFLRYVVNNSSENKVLIKSLVKDYIQLYKDTMKEDISSKEIDEAFVGFDSGMDTFKTSFNNGMDLLKDVKILGDKGIVLTYTLNEDGYIINETGTIDFAIDMKKIYAAFNNGAVDPDYQGIYKITLDINTDITNINKDVQVTFPELTSENSYEFTDLMKYYEEENQRRMGAFEKNLDKVKSINVFINNKPVYFSSSPKEVNGSIIVPMRETFTALGSKIQWNEKAQSVTATKGSQKIVIKVKSKTAIVNGKTKALTTPATMINDKVYVPIRFVSESLGCSVKYDSFTRSVSITTK